MRAEPVAQRVNLVLRGLGRPHQTERAEQLGLHIGTEDHIVTPRLKRFAGQQGKGVGIGAIAQTSTIQVAKQTAIGHARGHGGAFTLLGQGIDVGDHLAAALVGMAATGRQDLLALSRVD